MPLRDLTPEEAQHVLAQGGDPSKIKIDTDLEQQFKSGGPQQQGGAGQAFIHGAEASAVPSAAGGIGAGLGMGALEGAELGPVGSLIGALIGAGAASYGASKAQDALMSDQFKQQLATEAQQHPYAAAAGNLATVPLGGFSFSPSTLEQAGSYAGSQLLGTAAKDTLGANGLAAGKQAFYSTLGGAGLNAGVEAGREYVQDGTLDPTQIGEAAAIGGLFNRVNMFGKAYNSLNKAVGLRPGFHVDASGLPTDVAAPSTDATTIVPENKDVSARKLIGQVDVMQAATGVPGNWVVDNKGKVNYVPMKNAEESARYMNQMLAPDMTMQQFLNSDNRVQTSDAQSVPNAGQRREELKLAAEQKRQQDLASQQSGQAELARQNAAQQQTDLAGNALDIQQSLLQNQMGGQEIRPNPLATTDMGKDIYADYTGNMEHDSSMNEQESAADLAARRLEGNNDRYSKDESTPLEDTLTPAEQANPEHLVQKPSQEYQQHANQNLAGYGVDVKDNPQLEQRGAYNTETQEAQINPDKERVATRTHELLHRIWQGLPAPIKQTYIKLTADKVNDWHNNRVKWNSENPDKKQMDVSFSTPEQKAEEYFARDMAARYGDKLTQLKGQQPTSGEYFKDFLAHLKASGDKASLDDIQRSVLARITGGDSPVKRALNTSLSGVQKNSKEEPHAGWEPGEPSLERTGQEEQIWRNKVMPQIQKDEGTRYFQQLREQLNKKSSADEETPFTTKSMNVVSDKKYADKTGKLNGSQMLGVLKNQVSPMEWSVLEGAGIRQAFEGKILSQEDAEKWVKENSPRVEVRKFGEGSASTPEQRRFNELEHYFDSLPRDQRAVANHYLTHLDSESFEKLTPEQQKFAQEYEKLNKKDLQKGNEPAHWSFIAPKPERNMPGYVEIAVVKPQRKLSEQEQAAGGKSILRYATHEPPQFPSSHKFPPNTIGFVRGYMEKDPVTGEKTFHVIEVQADQKAFLTNNAKRWEVSNTPALEGKDFATREEAQAALVKHEPLMAHTERLALKAAIDHARSEGATRIAISDAETAMMSEKHDIYPNHVIEGDYNSVKKQLEKTGLNVSQLDSAGKFSIRKPGYSSSFELRPEGNGFLVPTKLAEEYPDLVTKKTVSQEPGMRLHYDRTLPKVAEELTGSKGERAEFGEHEKAFTDTAGVKVRPDHIGQWGIRDNRDGTIGWARDKHHAERLLSYFGKDKEHYSLVQATESQVKGQEPRKDLIFRNPDGTPKTSVTARSYPLEKVNARREQEGPFTLFNKYSSDEHIPARSLNPVEPELDKALRKAGPSGEPAVKALSSFLTKRREYQGKYESQMMAATSKLTQAEKLKLHNVLSQEDITGQPVQKGVLTGKEQSAYVAIRNAIRQHQEDQIKAGQKVRDIDGKGQVFEREARINPTYYPSRMKQEFMENLMEHKGNWKYVQNELMKHWTAHGDTPEQAAARLKQFTEAMDTKTGNQTKFRGNRLAEGLGLPASLRDNNLERTLQGYNRRHASDRAWYDTVEKNPEAMKSLEENKHVFKNLIEQMQGEPFDKNEAWIKTLSRVATSSILGPLTNLHILGSSIVNPQQYLKGHEIPSANAEALKNWSAAREHALKTGYLQHNPSTWNDLVGAGQTHLERTKALADMIGKVNGRDWADHTAKIFAQSLAEQIVPLRLADAERGDAYATNLIKQLDPYYAKGKVYSPEDKVKLASTMAGFIHGAHDARTLPEWMNKESIIKPFTSLMSWSVAQTNQWMKNVWEPATHGNIQPLLISALGAGIGGYAIQQMRQRLSDKKSAIPSLTEIANSSKGLEGNIPLLAYNFMQMASYTGFAGLGSTLAKDLFDTAYKNIPQGSSFPLDEITMDVGTKVMDAVSAWQQTPTADSFMKIMPKLMLDILKDNNQSVRIASNWMADTGNNTDAQNYQYNLSNKEGQLRRWKMAEGLPVDQQTEPNNNPYLNLNQKDFKRTQNLQQAASEVPGLIQQAQQKSGGDIDAFRNQLESLKKNNYETMPSPETNPIMFNRYYQYLVKNIGQEAAQEFIKDYFQHTYVNQAKSSMIPSFSTGSR